MHSDVPYGAGAAGTHPWAALQLDAGPEEHTRAAVCQPAVDPGVVITWAVHPPPDGAGAAAFIEMVAPHVLAGGTVQADETVALVHDAKQAASPYRLTASEHDCPDAVHVQLHVSALPVGPAFASRALGYPVGQGGGDDPNAPVQSRAGPDHPPGTGGAHA